jgi:hypothetical protein
VPTRTVHLSTAESVRLDELSARSGEGPSVLLRIAFRMLIGEPLPPWARELVIELRPELDEHAIELEYGSRLSGV